MLRKQYLVRDQIEETRATCARRKRCERFKIPKKDFLPEFIGAKLEILSDEISHLRYSDYRPALISLPLPPFLVSLVDMIKYSCN